MGAISFFDEFEHGRVCGSSFGEPDGTEHVVKLLEGNRRMILQVTLENSNKCSELVFTNEQAIAFSEAAQAILQRLSLNKTDTP